ncbi:Diphthamide synthase [Candidatus Bilamarchaeum dharawalense]|uniref:Diphthamide synthase n=1 Tax=Candidatus Bilamarchaeum dharawalense TaxID=2885759 RepID=A0A5E4LUZ1_9ARCH|nr:Diphthamide synthase [Candidatus Bilamarchaeum dharawalense]
MRVAVLFSGGKDSTHAAGWALEQGYKPILITVKPPEYSMMFHHPNIHVTELQARAMGLEQIFVETTEENWRDQLVKTFKKLKVEAIVSGAVASTYQKSRLDDIASELNIKSFAPLWHADEHQLKKMLDTMEIFVIAVSAEGLDEKFLGEPLKKLVEAKVKNVHPFLEGGEGETFVTDAPFFKKRIKIKKWNKKWDGVRGVAEIVEAELVGKD